ncbi:MAG: hypothetical protein IIA44_07880, partial [Acidobacteria bacterium]|nr:hypothetical protein [Acidobacteriota bacterium]
MKRQHTSWIGMCALGTVLVVTAGCSVADDLLNVDNPTQIPIADVSDIALLEVR